MTCIGWPTTEVKMEDPGSRATCKMERKIKQCDPSKDTVNRNRTVRKRKSTTEASAKVKPKKKKKPAAAVIDERHSCHLCKHAYRTETFLTDHYKAVHRSVIERGLLNSEAYRGLTPITPKVLGTASCDLCGLILVNKFAKKRHMKSHRKAAQKKYPVAKRREVIKEYYSCCNCGWFFITEGNLTEHFKEKHSHLKVEISKGTWESEFKDTNLAVRLKASKRCKCDRCGLILCDLSTKIRHLRIHTNERKYLCQVCGVSFVQSANLISHTRIHENTKPYACRYCDKTYRVSSQRIRHEALHTGCKRHICKVCGKAFFEGYMLSRHMRSHTNERPFACTYCAKTFRTATQSKEHERTHTGEKPYVCDLCGKCFTQGGNLMTHKRKHNEARGREQGGSGGRKIEEGKDGERTVDQNKTATSWGICRPPGEETDLLHVCLTVL